MENTLRVRRAEKGKGHSQRAVAKAVEIHADRYWRIENGFTEPTPEEQAALADYFGIKVSALFKRVPKGKRTLTGAVA